MTSPVSCSSINKDFFLLYLKHDVSSAFLQFSPKLVDYAVNRLDIATFTWQTEHEHVYEKPFWVVRYFHCARQKIYEQKWTILQIPLHVFTKSIRYTDKKYFLVCNVHLVDIKP